MRVLLLGPVPPPHGGIQTHLVALRDFLRSRHVPCAVINITSHRQPESDEIYYPRSALGLLRRLLRTKADIVHLHFGGNLSLRLLALTMVCCALPRSRTILTFHSGGYPQSAVGKAASRWSLRGFVLRRLDRVVGVNRELVDMFERFGVAPSKALFIAPHTSVQAPAASVDAWPAELHRFFETRSPVLLAVCGLEPEYQIGLQIEMLDAVLARFPRAGLVIIGGGSLEQSLRAAIAAKSYRNQILLCGDVAHAVTLQAIARADLLLRITKYDGDSIAVREALALGTPVLASDTGMRPEGVVLTSETAPQALALTVAKCLEPGIRRARQENDDQRNIEEVLRVYTELSGTSRRTLSSRFLLR